jgi:hypothetical protein
MIQIEIDDREMLAALSALARRAAHLRPALADIGELLVMSTKQRFAVGRAPAVIPAAPVIPSRPLSFRAEGEESHAHRCVEIPRFARDDKRAARRPLSFAPPLSFRAAPCHSEPKARNLMRIDALRSLASLGMTTGPAPRAAAG